MASKKKTKMVKKVKKTSGKKAKPAKGLKKKIAPKAVSKKTKAAPKKKIAKKVIKAVKKVKTAKGVAKAKPASKKTVVKAPVKAIKKTAIAKTPVVKMQNAPKVDYSKAITPLGDRLVVRVLSAERVTAGGIIIPDSAVTETGFIKAKVLAAGSGAKSKKGLLQPLDVQVGDTVLFNSYAGSKINFNSEELQIIHETDVMGVVQD